MFYNKSKFKPTDTHKKLHKRHKQWVILSTTALSFIGLSVSAQHVHADTNNSEQTQNVSNSVINSESTASSGSDQNTTISTSMVNTLATSKSSNSDTSHTNAMASKAANTVISTIKTTNNSTQDSSANINSAQTSVNSSSNKSTQASSFNNNSTQSSVDSSSTTSTQTSANYSDSLSLRAGDNNATTTHASVSPVTASAEAALLSSYDDTHLIGSTAWGGGTLSVDQNGNAMLANATIDNNPDLNNSWVSTTPVPSSATDLNGNNLLSDVKQLQFYNVSFAAIKSNSAMSGMPDAQYYGKQFIPNFNNLQTIDYNNTYGWDKFTNYSTIFEGLNFGNTALHNIILGDTMDTSNATNFSRFSEDNPLIQNIIFGSGFDTTKATTMSNFLSLDNSTKLDLSHTKFNLSNITNDPNANGIINIDNMNNTGVEIDLPDNWGPLNQPIGNLLMNSNNLRVVNLGTSTKFNNGAGLDIFGKINTENGQYPLTNANFIKLVLPAGLTFDSASGMNTPMFKDGMGPAVRLDDGQPHPGTWLSTRSNDAYTNYANSYQVAASSANDQSRTDINATTAMSSANVPIISGADQRLQIATSMVSNLANTYSLADKTTVMSQANSLLSSLTNLHSNVKSQFDRMNQMLPSMNQLPEASMAVVNNYQSSVNSYVHNSDYNNADTALSNESSAAQRFIDNESATSQNKSSINDAMTYADQQYNLMDLTRLQSLSASASASESSYANSITTSTAKLNQTQSTSSGSNSSSNNSAISSAQIATNSHASTQSTSSQAPQPHSSNNVTPINPGSNHPNHPMNPTNKHAPKLIKLNKNVTINFDGHYKQLQIAKVPILKLVSMNRLANHRARLHVIYNHQHGHVVLHAKDFSLAYYRHGDVNIVNTLHDTINVKALKPIRIYHDKEFKHTIKHVKPGEYIQVKNNIKYKGITRFETSDGHYMTSNKYFVQVIEK